MHERPGISDSITLGARCRVGIDPNSISLFPALSSSQERPWDPVLPTLVLLRNDGLMAGGRFSCGGPYNMRFEINLNFFNIFYFSRLKNY